MKQGKQKLQANLADKSSSQQSKSQQAVGGPGGQHQSREGARDGFRDGARGGGPKYREPGVLPPPSGMASQSAPNLAHIPQVQPFWWHSRLYPTDVNAGNY